MIQYTQYSGELTEEESLKQKEIWEKWLKEKPKQQKQPSDFFNDIVNLKNNKE